MNCVIYARVSTEDQAELSIPAQIQAMREYAQRQSWNVIAEFVEPGVSGRSIEGRPALQAMLKRCRETPTPDVVLVHKIDRLARSVFDHATIRYVLQQQRIRLASVAENLDDSVSGQLVENIMASIAQFYSANLGEEVKKGLRQKIAQGGWPHVPLRGYKLRREDSGKNTIEIDEDVAPAIRKAFVRYATGRYSLHQIRLGMARDGLLTRVGKPIPLEGVRFMLTNPFYTGRMRWRGAEYPGKHPALVPEAMYLKVQTVLRERHRDTGEKGRLHFLMRGVAFCAACGSKMTAERHGRWSYYRCVKNVSSNRLCSAPYSNVEKAHKSLRELYDGLKLTTAMRDSVQRAGEQHIAERVSDREKRLRALKMRQAKLEGREVGLSEAFAGGDLSLKAYRSALVTLRGQFGAVAQSIRDVDADPHELRERLRRVLDVAESLTDLERRLKGRARANLLNLVFKRIEVDRGRIVSHVLREPFNELFSCASGTGPSGRHLEDLQVRPTIKTIFEFDCNLLDALDETQANERAA